MKQKTFLDNADQSQFLTDGQNSCLTFTNFKIFQQNIYFSWLAGFEKMVLELSTYMVQSLP